MYVDGGFPVRTAVGRSVRYRSEVLKERERDGRPPPTVNVRFPPIPAISGMSAFDPFRT